MHGIGAKRTYGDDRTFICYWKYRTDKEVSSLSKTLILLQSVYAVSFFETTGQMHFTPPVQTIYAARQALDEYFREGEESKWKRHSEVFEAIRAGLDKLGFKDIIRRDLQAGLGVTVKYPDDENWSFEKVHDYCYKRGLRNRAMSCWKFLAKMYCCSVCLCMGDLFRSHVLKWQGI